MTRRGYWLCGASGLAALLLSTQAAAQTASTPVPATAPDGVAGVSEDIVVTASKRTERLIDLPISVTAISSANLSSTGQVRLEDYAGKVPGLFVSKSASGGTPSVSLRGIGASFGSASTVGIYVNDVPFSYSARATGGFGLPDIDPSEFERIEVLRGPQGTLYGGGTIGGVIKYVTRLPTFDDIAGRVEVGAAGVKDGGIGYSGRGAVNLPLGDKVAARVSAYYRRDPGFIDNLQLGQKDVNSVSKYGARVSLLAKLGDAVTARVDGYLEHGFNRGNPIIDISSSTLRPLDPDLTVRRAPQTDSTKTDNKLVALNLDADLGFANLASVTGYGRSRVFSYWDYSPVLVPPLEAIFGLTGNPAAKLTNDTRSHKISEEVRLTSPSTGRLTWQLAAFYTREVSTYLQTLDAIDGQSGATIALPVLGTTRNRSTYEEYAIFGNATYKLTDKLDVSGGLRYTHDKQHADNFATGVLLGTTSAAANAKESPVSYMANLRYHFSRDSVAYLRVASAYRPGGSNALVAGTPPSYGPDKAVNYEIGFKTQSADRRLSLDLSAFWIDWSSIQIFGLSSLSTSYIFNGGTARSRGVEAAATYTPVEGFTLSGNLAYIDAVLTKDLPPPNVGLKGDSLPGVAKFTSQISADYRWTLSGDLRAGIGASYRYVGKRPDTLEAGRYTLPSYDTLDLRVELAKGPYTASLFATNVTDARGYLSSLSMATVRRIVLITPRTIGVTLARTF